MIVVVIGLKGGVGATRCAIRLARAAAARGPTVAIDLDRWHGDLAHQLGVRANTGIADLGALDAGLAVQAMDDATLDAVTWRAADRLSVIPSPADPELAELVEPPLVRALVERVATAADVVIDAGSHVDAAAFEACAAAWRIVLVGRPDAACERAASTLLDLFARGRIEATVQLALPGSMRAAAAMAGRLGIQVAPDVARPRIASLVADVMSAARDTRRIAAHEPAGGAP